jgi:hypothetical protein
MSVVQRREKEDSIQRDADVLVLQRCKGKERERDTGQ